MRAGCRSFGALSDRDIVQQPHRAEPRRRNEDAPRRPEHKGGVLGEYGLTEEQGNEIIMAARAHWFDDEEAAAADVATEESEA